VEPGDGEIPQSIDRLSDTEVSQRLAYLEQHLDAGRDYAWWWWHGWTAFYSVGVVVEAARAGTADNDAQQADDIIGAVKAAGGVAQLLLRPLAAKDGADAVRALPDTSPADRRRRLAVGEALLRTNAEAANRRYSWVRHVLIVVVNAAGAIIVWQGFDDPSRGWRSAGIGIAVGELSVWSQPWWPAQDWEDYQRRFDGTRPRLTWQLAPTPEGLALHVNF